MSILDFYKNDLLPRLAAEDVLGHMDPRRTEAGYIKLTCPSCGRRPAYCYDGSGWIRCSHIGSCGYSASILAFLNGGEHPRGQRFAELVEELARVAGVPYRAPPTTEELEAELARAFRDDSLVPDVHDALSSDAKPVQIAVPGSTGFGGTIGRMVWNYAAARGITPEEAETHGLRAAGSVAPKGKPVRGPWLVFPVLDGGEPVGWQARRITDGSPKYVSSERTTGWLWPDASKGARNNVAVLGEGIFDALGGLRLGWTAFATFGHVILWPQIEVLLRTGIRSVILAYDPDAAGDHRGRDRLSSIEAAVASLRCSFRVYVADLSIPPPLPGGRKADLGEALRSKAVADWARNALLHPLPVDGPGWTEWRARQAMRAING